MRPIPTFMVPIWIEKMHPERDHHAPLAAPHVEDAAVPRPPRVAQDHQPAQHEAEEGEAQRRRVGEADLHRDRVGAPQRGQRERGHGAAPVEGTKGSRSRARARRRGTAMSAAMVAWPPMKIGLVGLPKSGKTSLFNLLTGATVATSSFGTARGEMHAGVARVPDARVERLTALFKPKKTTYATFEVVDLAGIAKGDRQGLEAKEFRNADALLHVVRAFPDTAGAAADPGRRHRRPRDRADPGRSRGGGAAARAARGADQEEADRHRRVRAERCSRR